jgi:hypothetical protein
MGENPYTPPQSPVRDPGAPRAVAQRPRNVVLAVRLLWISLVASIPVSMREYQEAAAGADASFLLYFILALYAISVLVNVYVYRGSNFARGALLVFMALNLLSFLGAPQQFLQYPTGDLLAIAISMLLDLAAIVLVFTRPGALWFRPARA